MSRPGRPRAAISLVTALAAMAIVPVVAFGFLASHNYKGQIRHDPITDIGFKLKRTESGGHRVKNFTAGFLTYTCEGGESGRSGSVMFLEAMRVNAHREFSGKGSAVVLAIDPRMKVRGKLRRGGTAVGIVRMRGEIDPADQPGDTTCATGRQEWRAERQPQNP